jgi:hypothetical protein
MIRIYPRIDSRRYGRTTARMSSGTQRRQEFCGRRPYQALRTTMVNDFPSLELQSTYFADVLQHHHQDYTLPLLVNAPINHVFKHRIAKPSPYYPGYWKLSNKHGLFFRHWSCINNDGCRTKYFYKLKRHEVKLLKYRSKINNRYNSFNFLMNEWRDMNPSDPISEYQSRLLHPGNPRILELLAERLPVYGPIQLFGDTLDPHDKDNASDLPFPYEEFPDPLNWIADPFE